MNRLDEHHVWVVILTGLFAWALSSVLWYLVWTWGG